MLPSGRTTLIFSTDIRLSMSLWMLSATPGYWDEHRNNSQINVHRATEVVMDEEIYGVCENPTWIFIAISLPSFNIP